MSSHLGHSLVSNPAVAFKINTPRRATTIAAATFGDPSEDSYDDDTEDNPQGRSTIVTNKKETFDLMNFFLQLLRRTLAAAAIISSIALALFAITPTLLSHPYGLSTALNVVNTTVPAVTVEIDSLKAGWRKPLEIKGVKILEKFNKHATERSNSDTKRTLLEVHKIKSTATLLDLALRSRPSDVIVAAPHIDVTINDQGNLRVLQALQDAGLAPLPRQKGKKKVREEGGKQQEGIPSTSATPATTTAVDTANAATAVSNSLQQVSTSIPFSGEIRAGNVHVALTSGHFLAPTEFRELFADKKDATGGGLGSGGGTATAAEVPEIHFEVLMGGDIIEEEAKLEEQQAGFVYKGQDQENVEEVESSLADWARQKPSVHLPQEVGEERNFLI